MIQLTTLLWLALAQAEDPIEAAKRLVAEGRGLEALQTLETASRAEPEDASLQFALGAIYASAGRTREAERAVARAVELEPDNTEYGLAYGEILFRSGDSEGARAQLERAGDDPDAMILLAAVYEKLNEKESAIATLERYLRARPEDRGARVLLGEQLSGAKRYDEALSVYRDGLTLFPDDALLMLRVAEGLSRDRSGYEEAEAVARRALEIEPDALEVGLLLARILDRSERYPEALEELERLREAHPEASQVHYNLTTAYQRAGRTDEARLAAERFQTLSQAEKEASDREARVAVTYKSAIDKLQQGDMTGAQTEFERALAIDPNHAQTHSMLAKIAFSRGRVGDARQSIDQALANDDTVAEFHYLKALFELRGGNPAAAVPAVRRSLEIDPAFADAWSMLGTLLLDSGSAEEALSCFQRAVSLEPQNATLLLNLASAHAALGDEAAEREAIARYEALSRRN